ncbi:MAG: isopentenyl phosphate kinase [Candidatus Bathyarchaeia archaeon]
MRSNELTILKLGGSVITFKDRPLTPNMLAIKRLAKEIAESQFSPLIIVHGGGSFGHPLASEYKITNGFKSKSQMTGLSKTHNAMIRLNMLVIESLLNAGLPAFSIAPSSFIITRHGRIKDLFKDVLAHAVKLGFTPVLYGDAVFDCNLGFTILSGDQLVSKLAIELDARRIIAGVDVDGLYTADPKVDPNAQFISHITVNELKSLLSSVGGSRVIDVTGGMMGKVSELLDSVERGVEALIVNALKPNNIYRALRGEEVIGTKITRR